MDPKQVLKDLQKAKLAEDFAAWQEGADVYNHWVRNGGFKVKEIKHVMKFNFGIVCLDDDGLIKIADIEF